MNDIVKMIKSLEESGLLIKGVSETVKNEAKKQKGAFHRLATLGVSLLGNLLVGKDTIRAGKGTITAAESRSFNDASGFLMSPHLLANF